MTELRDSGFLTKPTTSASGDRQAWKRLIGNELVDARLQTLPENKLRRSAFAISSSVQLMLALFVISLPLFFPERLSVRMIYEVTPVAAPLTEVPKQTEKPEIQKKEPAPAKPVEPVRVAKLFAPQPLVAPKPKVPERQNAEIPKLQPVLARAKFDASIAEPAELERPREPVKTGLLDTGSPAPATLTAAPEKVQTGGFGAPNGFGGDTTNAQRGNVARVGSFELPAGPGYGNGAGGINGLRGRVASAGFGSSVASTPAVSGTHGAVQPASFGSAEIAPAAKSAPKKAEEVSTQPVVILSKPNPLYTEEARKLGIEGEVLVEVIFRASGQVQTVRVVKGLGHGLDEAARRAAEQIRFQPARQEGQAVDFPAIAHIVFQLAY